MAISLKEEIVTTPTKRKSTLKQLAGAAILIAAASLPALAQVMGSSNRNAPKITQTIAFGADTIAVEYTSITWGEGQWAAQLANEATKVATRTRINGNADKQPMGSLKNSVAIVIGTQKVAAGTWKLEFLLDEAYQWQLVLVGEGGSVTCPLEMKTVDEERKRLHVGLGAGEKDFTAELAVGFGKSRCKLPVTLDKKSS
jgi:hypothetical protein